MPPNGFCVCSGARRSPNPVWSPKVTQTTKEARPPEAMTAGTMTAETMEVATTGVAAIVVETMEAATTEVAATTGAATTEAMTRPTYLPARANLRYQPSLASVLRRIRCRVAASLAVSTLISPANAVAARRKGMTCTNGAPFSSV